ncbi:MAG: sensor histidine kinase [Geobacteraceae bacterium]|nr:sensor histidine kinase [Geobacteraceae bacterium]
MSHPVFEESYYLINGVDGLVVMGMILCPGCRKRLGCWFLPLLILLFSAVPIITGNVAILRTPYQVAGSTDSTILRNLPMLLMPLLITAWRYGWRHVVVLTMTMVGLRLSTRMMFFPKGDHFLSSVETYIVQVIGFLLIGYFICYLITRLKEQNVSLQAAHTQLIHYASTLEHLAMSRERNRLARELHDTLAHTLTALSVQLETAKAYFEVDPAAAEELINQSLQATRAGLVETRLALKSLRAGPLDDLGILLALRKMAEESASRARLELHLILPDTTELLSPDVEQAVYRVAQEAVTNVVNHANARTLTLQLTLTGGRVALTVRDDGMGFDSLHHEPAGRFGLAGMRERAQLVGGHLTVESIVGQGTAIIMTI